MPLTIREAEDASLGAWTDVQNFMTTFLQDWNSPTTQLGLSAANHAIVDQWNQIPPEGHAALQAQNPEGYQNALAQVNKLKQKLPNQGG